MYIVIRNICNLILKHLWVKIPHGKILIQNYYSDHWPVHTKTQDYNHSWMILLHKKKHRFGNIDLMHSSDGIFFLRLWKRKESPLKSAKNDRAYQTRVRTICKKHGKIIIAIAGHGPDNVKSLNCQFCVLFMGNLPSNLLQSISPTIQRKYWWEITASSPIYYVYIIHLTKS